MKRRIFLQQMASLSILPALQAVAKPNSQKNQLRLIRHATLWLNWNNKKLLIDPMFAAKAAMDPVQNAANIIRIPMVDLPLNSQALEQLIQQTDAVMLTHIHRDHWDAAAQAMIPKSKKIFCQPTDADKIKALGFTDVQPVEDTLLWEGIRFHRTGGQHGSGETGKRMGIVSGFVITDQQQSVYIAGDTIWCDEVKQALDQHKPHYTVLNAGGAQFLTGGPITMTPEDVMEVQKHLPSTKIIAVHMDTINHCLVTRSDLKSTLSAKGFQKISIPEDGETITLT